MLLSKSIFEQIIQLNLATQELYRNHLAHIKNELIPEFMALVDHAEVHALLTPGTLSDPLMQQISELYIAITQYAQEKAIIDFTIDNRNLLVLNDVSSIQPRVKCIHDRMKIIYQKRFEIDYIETACNIFFDLLSQRCSRFHRS